MRFARGPARVPQKVLVSQSSQLGVGNLLCGHARPGNPGLLWRSEWRGLVDQITFHLNVLREGLILMPKVKANNITMNYDQQGTGEPLILIPYLAADHACYAFQVAEYAKHFTCISLDLRGTGETDKPEGAYSTELLADDVAAFMQAAGIKKAHISGHVPRRGNRHVAGL